VRETERSKGKRKETKSGSAVVMYICACSLLTLGQKLIVTLITIASIPEYPLNNHFKCT